jgi:hypothetical protein
LCDANTDTYPDSNAYPHTDANTNSDADTHSNPNAYTKRQLLSSMVVRHGI